MNMLRRPFLWLKLAAPCLALALALFSHPAHAAYTLNADGTVTDTVTHLVWDRCVLGRSSDGLACGSGMAQTFTWPQALAEVQARNAANHLGHRDWRLPSATELLSLVDIHADASATSAIDATAFPRTPSYGDTWSDGRHWTSTTLASNSSFAWTTGFRKGYLGVSNKTLYQGFVRMVRGGTFDSLGDTAPPLTTAGPAISSGPTHSSATVSVTLNEASTGHWLLVPGTAAPAPTSAQVMAGGSYGSVTVVAADQVALAANSPGLIYLFGLGPGTTYTLYFAAIDESFNLQAAPSSLVFTTATPVDGACGSAHHSPLPVAVAPSTALCAAGEPSSVTAGSGAYSWHCTGTNGGADSGMCSTSRGYIVTPSAGLHGSISPSTPQVVAFNQAVSFNVLPDGGYGAIASGCAGSLSGNTYTTGAIVADCPVSASFTLNTYPVGAAASPAVGGTVICTPNPVSHGSTATCIATPNAGYTFSGWSGDCAGSGTCSLGAVSSAKAVTAQFTLNTYPLTSTASPSTGGSASCTPNPVGHGGTSICTATPSAGHTFTGWSGDCSGTGACSLSDVTAPRSVTAGFALNSYTVTATAHPTAGGSVHCTPNPVSHGSSSTCTATPNAGATFNGWSGDCSGTGACDLGNVTSAKNVTADFTLDSYTVTTTANPAAGGSVHCTPNPVTHGSSSTCTATPSAGFTFSGWSGDCSGTGACDLGNVTSAKNVTAGFTLNRYTVTTTASPAAGGSVSCTPSPVTHGGSSTCTATPNGGYTFSGWSGDCSGTGAGSGSGAGICSLSDITSAKSVSADFTLITSYSAASPAGGGDITTTVSGGGGACGLVTIGYQSASSVGPALPAGVAFPHGVVHFTTTATCAVGGTINVTLAYPGVLPPNTRFYKYGPATAGASPTWHEYPATVSGNTITYSVIDNGAGDSNANPGQITDPAGPGIAEAPAAAVGIPTLHEWVLVLLAVWMAATAVFWQRTSSGAAGHRAGHKHAQG
ncbi:DUF1566 domain-containing protein [Acidovorax sp. M2(2025)]|uniref:DUF1566 domain-containing protein n=1 Tax=Acidovorax sp. M2(2025) TaxID=3411355 RepID=UPI003BF5FDF0